MVDQKQDIQFQLNYWNNLDSCIQIFGVSVCWCLASNVDVETNRRLVNNSYDCDSDSVPPDLCCLWNCTVLLRALLSKVTLLIDFDTPPQTSKWQRLRERTPPYYCNHSSGGRIDTRNWISFSCKRVALSFLVWFCWLRTPYRYQRPLTGQECLIIHLYEPSPLLLECQFERKEWPGPTGLCYHEN